MSLFELFLKIFKNAGSRANETKLTETKAEPTDQDGDQMIVIGLGNPGYKYVATRHNAGFMAVDLLAGKLGEQTSKEGFNALFTIARANNKKFIIAKPTTFMNLSGQAVLALLSFYKLSREKLIVIHDDLDLEIGRVMLRKGGSEGGHKGLLSISKELGSNDYIRIRIGIGRPPKERSPVDYVLEPFGDSELLLIEPALDKAAQAALEIINEGFVKAQNKIHAPQKKNHRDASDDTDSDASEPEAS